LGILIKNVIFLGIFDQKSYFLCDFWMECSMCFLKFFKSKISRMVLSPIAWFISSELSVQRYRSVIYCICFSLLNILITTTNSVCMLAFKVCFWIRI
jgi:hypothetical protein